MRTCSKVGVCVLVAGLGWATRSEAAVLTHTPSDGPNPAAVSPTFGTLVAGGAAGDRYVSFGVDYDAAGVVGVFNDPPLAFGGVNASGNVDLVSPVSGRLVVPDTTDQGATDFVSVLAGYADAGDLLLQAFDVNGALVGSTTNTVGGVSTLSITAPLDDIASFTVSTPVNDAFGVERVSVDTPVSVPEPTSLACVGLVAAGLAGRRRTRVG